MNSQSEAPQKRRQIRHHHPRPAIRVCFESQYSPPHDRVRRRLLVLTATHHVSTACWPPMPSTAGLSYPHPMHGSERTFMSGFIALLTGATTVRGYVCPIQCPLMAESGRSLRANFGNLNDRFREKRTLSLRLPKLNRKTSASPP